MSRVTACLALAVFLAAAAPAQPLQPGEQLIYSVSWAIVPGAGRITVDGGAVTEQGGVRTLQVQTKTETRGVAHMILPFEAWANSVYDAGSGRLIRFEESSKTRGKSAAHTLTFDYDRRLAIYRDPAENAPETQPLPPGNPADLINCLLEARSWHLTPGQARDALVFFENDFYELTVHAVGYEEVTTGLGTVQALLLEPRMEKTPPKGMFKRGSTVRVWVGRQEGRDLPLRFQVQFKVGSGVATLTAYRPAAAGSSRVPAPAPADQK